MKRLLAWYILIHLFSVGVGGMLGYGLYPLLHRSRPNVYRSDPLPAADRLRRGQGLAQERGEEGQP